MSYDLMVFDPQAPPPHRSGFIRWYEEQTQWNEGHSYDRPEITTSTLRAWYEEMRKLSRAERTRLNRRRGQSQCH